MNIKIFPAVITGILIIILAQCLNNPFPRKLKLEGYSAGQDHGIIKACDFNENTLILDFDNENNRNQIKISPLPELKSIKDIINCKIKIIAHDFTDGPSYRIEITKNDSLKTVIGIQVLENSGIINDVIIKKGNVVQKKDENRNWANIVIKSDIDEKIAASGKTIILDDNWKFLLIGASLPVSMNINKKNSQIDKIIIESEQPGFRADFIAFK